MAIRIAAGLLAMVVLLAAGSAILGVPVVGTYLGRDADFAIMATQMLSASWASGDLWPRWLMDATFGLGGTTFYSYPPLAYWAAAAIMALTDLSAPQSLGLAIAAWRMLAVATGYLWLRRHVSPATALAGAALGVLLPYVSLVDPWSGSPTRKRRGLLCCHCCCWRWSGWRRAERPRAFRPLPWPMRPSPSPTCRSARSRPILGRSMPGPMAAASRRCGASSAGRPAQPWRPPSCCLPLACCGKVTRQSYSTRPGATTSCFSRRWKSGLR